MHKTNVLQINSTLSELYKVEEFVESISDRYNINNNYYSAILISLDEAVRNAIEHGNNFDIDKKVTITFSTTNGELVFSVKDEGAGYEISDIDSTDYDFNRNLGKGLFLIKQLSDSISCNKEGSEISLHFKVSSINKELAVVRFSALKSYFQDSKQTIKA